MPFERREYFVPLTVSNVIIYNFYKDCSGEIGAKSSFLVKNNFPTFYIKYIP